MFFCWFFRVLRTTLLYDSIFIYDNMFNLKSQIYFGCISGPFNFKKLLSFTPFFNDPVRLGGKHPSKNTEPTGLGGENSIKKWTIE